MLVPILSMLGWMYLPDIVTRQILRFFHRFLNYTLRRPIPPPNTPQYWQQYRYTYALVITGYVVFHSRAVARSTKPNYYEMLGVDPSADENALKVAFRQFARKKHPDRVGPEGEALFIEVRDAFEALKNPVTRFAYDRFGSEALEWDHCSTPLDYIRYGLMQSAGFHAISAGALVLLSVIGGPSQVSYWRYLMFLAVCVFEMLFIVSPSTSSPMLPSTLSFSNAHKRLSYFGLFSLFWPRKVAYQHIRFLHTEFLLLSLVLSKVAPVLFPPDDSADPRKVQGALERLAMEARMIDRDLASQIHLELHSVHGPKTGTLPTNATFAHAPPCENPAPEVIDLITAQMESMFIESQLRDGGPLQKAAELAVTRRRRTAEEQSAQSGMPSPSPSPSPRHSSSAALDIFSRESGAKLGPQRASSERALLGYVRGRSKSLGR